MKTLLASALAAGALISAVGSTPAAAAAPSFDCRYAYTASERAICASGELSQLDRRLAYWYDRAQFRAVHFGQSSDLLRAQRSWLQQRDACGSNRWCLRSQYRSRIAELRRYYDHV
jgi:uncharacterized protein